MEGCYLHIIRLPSRTFRKALVRATAGRACAFWGMLAPHYWSLHVRSPPLTSGSSERLSPSFWMDLLSSLASSSLYKHVGRYGEGSKGKVGEKGRRSRRRARPTSHQDGCSPARVMVREQLFRWRRNWTGRRHEKRNRVCRGVSGVLASQKSFTMFQGQRWERFYFFKGIKQGRLAMIADLGRSCPKEGKEKSFPVPLICLILSDYLCFVVSSWFVFTVTPLLCRVFSSVSVRVRVLC